MHTLNENNGFAYIYYYKHVQLWLIKTFTNIHILTRACYLLNTSICPKSYGLN